MLVIDLIIVVLTLAMAVWGFLRGLTIGAVALVGFGGGAVLGSRLAPLLLDDGVHSIYAPILALPGALFFGGLLAAVLERFGLRLGRRLGGLRLSRRLNRLRPLDGIGGALLAGCLGLVVAWLLGATATQVHSLRDPLGRSTILRRLNAVLPPLGPVLVAQARPSDSFPTFQGPAPQVGRPDPLVTRDPQIRAAARSVVKIVDLGCGHGEQGSGWITAGGVVVTNAHVVAGADAIAIRVQGKGESHDAKTIWFDAKNDVALLRPSGVSAVPRLRLASTAKPGALGAVLGFPGGHWANRPARLGQTSHRVSGQVANAPIRYRSLYGRLLTAFAGRVQPGSSGGPMIDTRGHVVTTVAIGTGGGGFGVPNTIVRAALRRAGPEVGTGPCLEPGR